MASPQPLVQAYLFFNGNCAEAVEYYQSTLGAEVEMIMRYSDSPEPPAPGMVPDGWDDKVMHASFKIGRTQIMASDGCGDGEGTFSGFRLSLGVATEAEAKKAFDALAEGGKVIMPLEKTFWSPCFGMLQDKFGIGWMVNAIPPEQMPT